MISLQELLDKYKCYNIDDLTIIKEWFEVNSQYAEGIKMISELAAAQVREEETVISHLQAWNSRAFSNLYKEYDNETASLLDDAAREFISFGKCSTVTLEKLKKIVPTVNQPTVYFQDTIAYLENVHGIFFKDRMGKKPRDIFEGVAYKILDKRAKKKEEQYANFVK